MCNLAHSNITHQGHLAVPAVPGLQGKTQQLIHLGLWVGRIFTNFSWKLVRRGSLANVAANILSVLIFFLIFSGEKLNLSEKGKIILHQIRFFTL